jgi:hypothetical protein
MAVQPPPVPSAPAAPQAFTPPPPQARRGCRGCGFGCGGCLIAVIVVVLLLVGGGYWFFVAQASAAVNAPATLVVFTQPVTVDSNPAIAGQALNPGNVVQTQEGGRAGIQFPDGSYMRMSPNSTVTVTAVQLQKNGNLQSVSLSQKIGRTFVNVQKLVSGATFQVGGHSVSAQVRGTQFEMLVRNNGTNLIKVFEGTVKVAGKTTVTLSAGQEVDVAADGTVGAPRPITSDPKDPYPLAAQCAQSVSSGTTAGTSQTTSSDNIATGQTQEVGYDSSGGTMKVALCYPGSLMTITVIDPTGVQHPTRTSSRPAQLTFSGPAGHYRAIIRAVDAPGGEAFAVSFATDAPCTSAPVDTNNIVRQTLSNSQISTLLATHGVNGVTIQVKGASQTSARVIYFSTIGGTKLSWTIDFYAATPSLGAVITEVTVQGINVTTQVITTLSSFGNVSLSSIPSGYSVDRVYSCTATDGDTLMVVEGHR